MSMIKIENLTFSYPTSYDNVFENVSFQVDTDWKLGFVGRNGRGKTTFLNLLLGKYEYSGKILSSVQFDYFPYPVSDKNRITEDILQEICPLAEEWELMRELSYLDVDVDVLWRPFETLSNGEQTKVLIAALFLNEGHFLLIDEPTNHLDAKARKSVAAYLKKKKGFILVSHDRRFLDDCVDYILSINRANIEVQRGNFSSWMSNFERQQEFELAQNERLQKDIRRLQQSAKRAAVWSERVEASKIGAADKGYVGHKAAKMMKRAKSIEARRAQAAEAQRGLLADSDAAEALKLSPLACPQPCAARFDGARVFYGSVQVCGPVCFAVPAGGRVALCGPNGCGKTSLLHAVLPQKPAGLRIEGGVWLAGGTRLSYVPQTAAGVHSTPQAFARACGLEESRFLAILRKFGFSRAQFALPLEQASEGQKKKALLAKSLCESAHLYVWDEPLNYLDIPAREQLEALILEYSPTLLFTEHDTVFRQRIATQCVQL